MGISFALPRWMAAIFHVVKCRDWSHALSVLHLEIRMCAGLCDLNEEEVTWLHLLTRRMLLSCAVFVAGEKFCFSVRATNFEHRV